MENSLCRKFGVGFALLSLGFALTLPASSCPVAVNSSELELAEQKSAPFSPVSLVSAKDLLPAPQRAMARTECIGGFAGIYPCSNIDLMAFMPLADIGGSSGNDIWGWTDPQTNREYALMGRSSGTSFIDITDAENPVYLGNLPTQTSSSSWRDVKAYANHAFIVSEASDHGMQVFDLTQLRNVASPPQTFTTTAVYSNFGSAHNIVINEDSGFAYAVGTTTCSGGLHMVDISDPVNPASAGCFSSDGYTHDAQCVIAQSGSELCFNSNTDTLTIVDVTNKNAPVQLARLPYANSGYTHQGWLTEDHQYFLLDDELDEQNFGHTTKTRVFDVSDPSAPFLVGAFDSTASAIDHNLYVLGDYAYQANYRAGLRILKIENPATATLIEEAFFDIYPDSDSASFNGAWSNYPYFASGNVIVSGIEQGLFVLRPTSLQPSFDVIAEQPRLEVCNTGTAATTLDVRSFGGFAEQVAFAVSGAPAGATAQTNPAVLTPPGQTSLTVDVFSAPAGQFALTVDGTAATQSFSTAVGLDVSITPPPAASALLPADSAVEVSSNQTLYWSPDAGTYRYDVQIATDAAFTDILVDVKELTTNSFPANALPPGTTLYWRVIAYNACGQQESAVWSFTTAAASCVLVQSTDVPKIISPVGSNSVSSVLTTSASGEIVDVNVIDLRGDHTYLGDLDFQLEGPLFDETAGGATRHEERALVRIIERTCSSTNDFYLSLDDDAPAGALPCPYNDTNTYQPSNPLAAFAGNPGSGDWTLTINDNANVDGGSLQGWGLEVCTTPPPQMFDGDGDGVADAADNCTLIANPDQRDTNGDGYGNVCDPDLDNNGVVNAVDLGLLKASFFATGPGLDADFNGDNAVNVADLGILKLYFFGPPGPSGTAP